MLVLERNLISPKATVQFKISRLNMPGHLLHLSTCQMCKQSYICKGQQQSYYSRKYLCLFKIQEIETAEVNKFYKIE